MEAEAMKMKMVFPWHGEKSPLGLEAIRGIPCMYGIACALSQIELGGPLQEDGIREMRESAERAGLAFETVSLLPAHADILRRRGKWEIYIENYRENIARLAREGVRCVCCGFASDEPVEPDNLWENLGHFMNELIPTAAAFGVRMAMYAGNPPDLAGGVAILASEADIDRFLTLRPEREHGLALCDSLGIPTREGYRKMARKYGAMGRVHFADLRNMKILEDIFLSGRERDENCAPIDMAHILKAFHDADFDGYVCPSCHGSAERSSAREIKDVALGATYLSGIWESLEAFGY
jgi:mannonate dehydratase